MRLKHNKKRNTLFLYETLIKELTKSVVKNDMQKKSIVLSILKEHFGKNSCLGKEVQLYKDILNSKELDLNTAEKILYETRMFFGYGFDQQETYDEQSKIISKVNKDLSKNVFSNFIPNYKDLATLSQIFNDDLTVKKRVMLENQIVQKMMSKKDEPEQKMKSIDKLTFKTFINKFNSTYGGLQEGQRNLLLQYILSFSDDKLDLKVYLNEEIGRLKEVINNSLDLEEIKTDPSMLKSTKKVLDQIGKYKNQEIDDVMITQVLKIQSLAEEIQADG